MAMAFRINQTDFEKIQRQDKKNLSWCLSENYKSCCNQIKSIDPNCMRILNVIFTVSLFLLLLSSCKQDVNTGPLFTHKDNERIGVNFSNNLTATPDFNVYKYRNFYNGGGVGMGDINNDGLIDVYLIANQSPNKLYLNKGNFEFEDITEKAGVGGQKSWSTGVSFVDINQDGLLDIYVCNSGDIKGDNKENELFINQGDMTFVESAAAYNLNDKGYTTHANFFDYDRDGDLDVYILNNSYQAIGSFNLKKNERPKRDLLGGDKLMENRDGKFYDVSEAAGIYGSVIGFGLGITISDFNNDRWPDIFISNDFFERDYLYINQQNGTFQEDLEQQMKSTSAASMGADAADIDNDGNADLFVTDMLPYEYERLKTVTTFEDWNKYQYNVKNGYHHQFNRNVLQRNNGNNSFSEISRLSGVEASDWSWGALFFDMDNDGFKDLFVATGIYKDLTNQDYLAYIANETVMKAIVTEEGVNYKELIDIIPSNPVENHAYLNTDGLNFEKFDDSGLWQAGFSNGSAYGDLDNDGDLDLVVNNVNNPCYFFENNSRNETNHFVKIELAGNPKNQFGFGATIRVTDGDRLFQYENIPARGFQSSMDYRPNIGVGKAETVDVEVLWPSGNVSRLTQVSTNQTLTIKESDGKKEEDLPSRKAAIFREVPAPFSYLKEENNFVDFNRERLVYHMRSNEGGKIGQGDLNGDGVLDLVLPGAKGFQTEIYFGKPDGSYDRLEGVSDLAKIKEAEHIKAILFDADGDQDLDVFLASGGVELSPFSTYLYDHLLLNQGNGVFTLSTQKFPADNVKISTGAVAHGDVDGDGDTDLFLGERVKIGKFGMSGSGYFLLNDGKGNFKDATKELGPDFMEMGMITDATFANLDSEADLELIIVGEFMEIQIFKQDNGVYKKIDLNSDIPLNGWWNTLQLADIDQDGDLDILAGNLGENSRFTASQEHPLKLYFSDFDHNGMPEGVMSFNAENEKDYPYALRHILIDQMKSLKKRFPDFESFKAADMTKIFTEEELNEAKVLITDQLKTVLLINGGDFNFTSADLPTEVQFSPVYATATGDFDRDGDLDLLFGGNLFRVLPEMGIYDGSYGQFVENLGDGKFSYQKDGKGLMVKGEIRDFVVTDKLIMVNVSGDSLRTFGF